MAKFPVDAPKAKVIRTLETLGFRLLRAEGFRRAGVADPAM